MDIRRQSGWLNDMGSHADPSSATPSKDLLISKESREEWKSTKCAAGGGGGCTSSSLLSMRSRMTTSTSVFVEGQNGAIVSWNNIAQMEQQRDRHAISSVVSAVLHSSTTNTSIGTTRTMPCAACKLLRRRCVQGCLFVPYFSLHK